MQYLYSILWKPSISQSIYYNIKGTQTSSTSESLSEFPGRNFNHEMLQPASSFQPKSSFCFASVWMPLSHLHHSVEAKETCRFRKAVPLLQLQQPAECRLQSDLKKGVYEANDLKGLMHCDTVQTSMQHKMNQKMCVHMSVHSSRTLSQA